MRSNIYKLFHLLHSKKHVGGGERIPFLRKIISSSNPKNPSFLFLTINYFSSSTPKNSLEEEMKFHFYVHSMKIHNWNKLKIYIQIETSFWWSLLDTICQWIRFRNNDEHIFYTLRNNAPGYLSNKPNCWAVSILSTTILISTILRLRSQHFGSYGCIHFSGNSTLGQVCNIPVCMMH